MARLCHVCNTSIFILLIYFKTCHSYTTTIGKYIWVADDVNQFEDKELNRKMKFVEWQRTSWSMADCKVSKDCLGIRMKCIDNKCMCDFQDHVLLEDHWLGTGCYPKVQLFDACLTSEQCLAVNRNTYCNRNNRCTCSHGFFFDGRDCIIRYDNNLKAQEVYKAAVVAAACFIVAIVGIFVVCIVRRSFCRREGNVHHTSPTNNDVFSVSDEIAALRAVDKPPSYEEVLQIERTFFGIPPPEYSSVRGSNRRPNQNGVSVLSSYFTNEAETHYLQQSGASAVASPTSDGSEPVILNSPSNGSNYSTTTTALVSSFSETSCANTIDTESTALPASSEESILKASSTNPLLSGADSVETELPKFFPVILQPLTRHASLNHHSPLTSRLSRYGHLSPSSASLPSSPQSMRHLTHNSTFAPSTDLSSLQLTAPQTPETSHVVPSNPSPTPCIAASPSRDTFSDDSSLDDSVNHDSRRDSLILCCEEAPSLTAYVNSAFEDDYPRQG